MLSPAWVKKLCYFKKLQALAKFRTGSLSIYILNKKESHATLFLAEQQAIFKIQV